ncbi:hypothetical protein BGZ46_006064 [Entomortierella lignicola]|nr:hypothetical protein BGZ46_006064 [Entomortierella lignicola]
MNIIRPVISSIQQNKGLTVCDASRLACMLLMEKHELDENYNILRPQFQAPVFPAFGNVKISEAEQQQLGFNSIDIKILTTALIPKTNSATSFSWKAVGEAFMKFFFASLGLQTTLMTDPGLGNTWIEDAEVIVRDRARGITNMENLHLSKILGDAMEALVGAIFIDGGMDLELVRRVVTRSYIPFIDGSGVTCHIGKGVTTNPVGKRPQAEDDQLPPVKKAKA